MPRYKLLLPDLGIDGQPITVSSWLVKKGARVTEDGPIIEVLCGAATVDLPAMRQGALVDKLVSDDEVIQTGQALALIETVE
jgi:2-oxoglutarate dehydrogenase E2 component (dihydrolipoamide succinyltransferase)